MKILIEVAELLKALSDVQGIIERKSINPILSNVKLVAKDNNLIISATDMNLYITKTISIEILEEGCTTVPSFQLFEIVKKLKDKDKLTLSLNKNHLSLECNSFKGNLPFLPVEDFPNEYEKSLDNIFKIESNNLKFLINKTKFAICLDDTRYYLNGIYFHKDNSKEGKQLLKAVATDGHRLALASIDLPVGGENITGIIIPKKTVEELSKILDKSENITVEVSTNNNMIIFKFPNLILCSNLIEGTFPEYNKVIPSNISYNINVNNKDFKEAIDLVATFSEDKIKAVKLDIHSNSLIVKAAKENGLYSGEQTLNLTSSHKELIISFNSKYILDILNLIDEEEVQLNLSTSNAPALINSKKNDNYLFVLMPMRL